MWYGIQELPFHIEKIISLFLPLEHIMQSYRVVLCCIKSSHPSPPPSLPPTSSSSVKWQSFFFFWRKTNMICLLIQSVSYSFVGVAIQHLVMRVHSISIIITREKYWFMHFLNKNCLLKLAALSFLRKHIKPSSLGKFIFQITRSLLMSYTIISSL